MPLSVRALTLSVLSKIQIQRDVDVDYRGVDYRRLLTPHDEAVVNAFPELAITMLESRGGSAIGESIGTVLFEVLVCWMQHGGNVPYTHALDAPCIGSCRGIYEQRVTQLHSYGKTLVGNINSIVRDVNIDDDPELDFHLAILLRIILTNGTLIVYPERTTLSHCAQGLLDYDREMASETDRRRDFLMRGVEREKASERETLADLDTIIRIVSSERAAISIVNNSNTLISATNNLNQTITNNLSQMISNINNQDNTEVAIEVNQTVSESKGDEEE